MAVSLTTNVAALNAQRRLTNSSADLSQSFTRLSSGLRINRAKDDAAGLAIASALNADARVFTQAVRNVNDGISYLNVADGATHELSSILIRIREIATQSSNGVYTDDQRAPLDGEVTELQNEFNRILNTASFNGVEMFSSEHSRLTVQAGYGTNGMLIADLGSTTEFGDASFETMVTYDVGSSAAYTDAGDVNGDSIPDVVVATYGGSRVSLFFGVGDGTLSAPSSFTVNTTNNGVFLGDVDGDTDLDIVLPSATGSGNVSVIISNGDGTFLARVSYRAGFSARDVEFADVNGDSKIDLITASSTQGVNVLLGNGNGTFNANTTFFAGTQTFRIATGYFNADAILDVAATAFSDNAVEILFGNSDGSFSAPVSYTVGASPQQIRSQDLNGDGELDLVVGASGIEVLFGNSDGSFTAGVSYASSSGDFALRDMNGDNLLDLVTADADGNNFSIRLGNGDGSFGGRTSYDALTSPSITVADLDGDSKNDVIVASYSGFSIGVLLGNGGGGSGLRPLSGLSVSTQNNARTTQDLLNGYIDDLHRVTGVIGASVSRFETAVNALRISTENFRAAESRITDADIAEEGAQLLKARILQQAGASVLAQANQLPALALTLLS